MCSASLERCIHSGTHALGGWHLVLEDQNEIHEIPHATVRRLAWARVRVKLFRPVLFDGERRDHNRRYPGEPEPVFALDAFERLEDFVSDTEVDVKLDERSTIETGIDWKPRAPFGRLIQFGHRLAHGEHEEVGQLDGRRDLKRLS
jgi:hypothetical protein